MTPENAVKKAVLDLLTAEGIFAFRLNTASFSGEHKGKKRFFQAHSLGKGAADILALPGNFTSGLRIGFRPLWIEVKAPGGKQSADQKLFQQWVQREGHVYLLAYSSDDLWAFLRKSRT